jgi:hypothetical protein
VKFEVDQNLLEHMGILDQMQRLWQPLLPPEV